MILLIWQCFADDFLSLPAPSKIPLSYETGPEILYVSMCISIFSCCCPFFTSPKGSEALFSAINCLPQREVMKTVTFPNIHVEAKRDDKAFKFRKPPYIQWPFVWTIILHRPLMVAQSPCRWRWAQSWPACLSSQVLIHFLNSSMPTDEYVSA